MLPLFTYIQRGRILIGRRLVEKNLLERRENSIRGITEEEKSTGSCQTVRMESGKKGRGNLSFKVREDVWNEQNIKCS
jgi:hypothetical protein